MLKTLSYGFLFLGISLLAFISTGCSGSKSGYDPGIDDSAPIQGSDKLEKAKLEAEEAEFEAHRLREELYRKKESTK